jgi:uncharacterized protein
MRIAIVGAGISGLMAAYVLQRAGHELTVYEAGDYVGGHSHTVECEVDGRCLPVDTGFIVHNDRTYPSLLRLLDELHVPTQATEMSFSVSDERSGLEYNGHTLGTLFTQRRNLVSPPFLGMLRDILRLNREARAFLAADGESKISLREFLERQRYGRTLRDLYLLPMGAAIWSSPLAQIERFPARAFFRFCENHGLLSVADRPEWRVIVGGSRRYVNAMLEHLRGRVRLATPARRVRRTPDAAIVASDAAGEERYDHVVLACHSDDALALLADPTPAERDVLGAIPYAANEAVLHQDARVLPRSRRAWASWNCRLPASGAASVTYNQSILQNFATSRPLCVTLNGGDALNPALVLKRVTYRHPQFSAAAFAAQNRHAEISGLSVGTAHTGGGRTHYCGAYWGWGFHEDGVVSGVRVAAALGARW